MLVVRYQPGTARSTYAVVVETNKMGHAAHEEVFTADTQAKIRDYLREHYRINNLSPAEEAERQRFKAAREAQEAAKHQQQDAEAERYLADGAANRARQTQEAQVRRETGAWLNDHGYYVRRDVKDKLKAALSSAGLPIAASWDVYWSAKKRKDDGASWADALQFGINYYKYLNRDTDQVDPDLPPAVPVRRVDPNVAREIVRKLTVKGPKDLDTRVQWWIEGYKAQRSGVPYGDAQNDLWRAGWYYARDNA
jgi:hypothetical protein